ALAPGGGIPAGTVLFKEGTTTLASISLDDNGEAQFTIATLDVGPHTITAEYQGEQNYHVSSDNSSLTVAPAQTTTTLLSSEAATVHGQAVVFTATVQSLAPGDGTPTGLVTFLDGIDVLGSASLDDSGQATLSTPLFDAGSHS